MGPSKDTPRPSTRASPPSVVNLLLVEDSPVDAFLVQAASAASPCLKWTHVEAVREAARCLSEAKFDAVLLDLGLPDSQGFDTFEQLRQVDPEVPIVIHSGLNDATLAASLVQRGAQGYVVKGPDADRVIESLRQAIERDQMRRELSRREAELCASEGRLRKIIDGNVDGIVIVDSAGIVRFVNPTAESLFACSSEELVGTQFGFPVVPRKRTEIVIPGSGATTTVEMRAVEIDWEGERAYCASLRDLTKHRELEQQLQQARKVEAVGLLAGGVAHDFNNILTIILGYCDLLAEDVAGQPAALRSLNEIREAGERASALTRQLLAFSRKEVVAPESLDLGEIVTNLSKMLRRLIGEDIELVTNLDPDCRVLADRGQIEQVLINLAANARDAMPDGGRLSVTVREVVRDAATAGEHGRRPSEPRRFVELTIADSGIGMNEEARRHAFEPFFTTKEKGHGTGLGLATVQAIVKQCGGGIRVDSSAGCGTRFEIWFPRTERAVTRSRAAHDSPTPGGPATVLLAEDDESIRKLARRLLEASNYRVVEAANGEEALEIAAGGRDAFDLLLTDVVMSGRISGRELADRLRADRRDLRVLYMSGYTDDEILKRGVLREDVLLLHKPFTPRRLLEKVREALDQPQPSAARPARRRQR